MTSPLDRREFLKTVSTSIATATSLSCGLTTAAPVKNSPSKMRLGLVTYNWGKNWDLPTLIRNCEATKFEGVELRSTHKHGVEITLSKSEREEVQQRFADSPVEIVGLGSACEYHSADPAVLKKNIEETKAFVHLCHDIGGTGVKVRPNGLPADVPVEKTLEQIGLTLNGLARYAADYGIELRLEVHGRQTASLPHIKTIMDYAEHPNAVVCWNCNPTDLDGDGLEANFKIVQNRIGTVHIHDLTKDNYPWQQLFSLLRQSHFRGWTLLEDGKVPEDIVAAMHANRTRWEELTAGSD